MSKQLSNINRYLWFNTPESCKRSDLIYLNKDIRLVFIKAISYIRFSFQTFNCNTCLLIRLSGKIYIYVFFLFIAPIVLSKKWDRLLKHIRFLLFWNWKN